MTQSLSYEAKSFGLGGRIRLQTLIRLRWVGAIGQVLAVLLVHVWLDFHLPLLAATVLIGALAVVNVGLSLRYPPTYRLEPGPTLALLSFDLSQMAGLLFITGGLTNPFAPLLCVPVIISSASQPIRYTVALGALLLVFISVLAFSPFPLPWYEDRRFFLPTELLTGTWFAILSMTAFAAFYAYRVSVEANQLSDALAATELVLQRENHLSQLDGLAAAAAHELGTPLATISVVAKEMQRALGSDERFTEDLQLLQSQTNRCKDILRRLTTLSTEDEASLRLLPFSSLVEEAMTPYREFGIKLELKEKSSRSGEPVGRRNAGIIYGLGNLIENAVDYAKDRVTVTTEYDSLRLLVVIEDDGPGYSSDILQRIGEPYVTSRSQYDSAGGLGLGLFIAKTLLERSGARLKFTNGNNGAKVIVEWPRSRMDATMFIDGDTNSPITAGNAGDN
ncbi:ActS/PrrB/RegB family redox-sensitive histidine kinase [Rhizobium sp. L1K21]|uniref:ActS/PrrB/RegB family redox-sensitive histidine kinase n=1 Tax=Rhizobium sp. L1K21 TaxID=2954933 RepID=UPI0020932B06|nr:ActS/PrrB/RegB family redox-sensitive histidine kinase [Rhizobium sp. L1K21]MCO6187937.1 ActS/PrrB/RegB family redox-sensitive histidine kinase [Rhizobium sp. L1K21]